MPAWHLFFVANYWIDYLDNKKDTLDTLFYCYMTQNL